MGDGARPRSAPARACPTCSTRIADETICTDVDGLLPFLEEKQHPALTMDPLVLTGPSSRRLNMTTIEIPVEKWSGAVREVTLGAADGGGTRAAAVTVGGETAPPFLHFEGATPHRPIVAVEVHDVFPHGLVAGAARGLGRRRRATPPPGRPRP